MMKSKDKYAITTLLAWYQDHIDLFKNHMAISIFNDSVPGSANVQLSTDKYMMDISVMDDTAYLCIGMLEIESDNTTYQHFGNCESKLVFETQLQNFIEWFKNKHKQNT